jgi:hypothetical protein
MADEPLQQQKKDPIQDMVAAYLANAAKTQAQSTALKDPLGAVARSNSRLSGLTPADQWAELFKPRLASAVAPLATSAAGATSQTAKNDIPSGASPAASPVVAPAKKPNIFLDSVGAAMRTRSVTGLPRGDFANSNFVPGQNNPVPASPLKPWNTSAANPLLTGDSSLFKLPDSVVEMAPEDRTKIAQMPLTPISGTPATPTPVMPSAPVPPVTAAATPTAPIQPLSPASKPMAAKPKGPRYTAPYGFAAKDQWEMLDNAGKMFKDLFVGEDGTFGLKGVRGVSLVNP